LISSNNEEQFVSILFTVRYLCSKLNKPYPFNLGGQIF